MQAYLNFFLIHHLIFALCNWALDFFHAQFFFTVNLDRTHSVPRMKSLPIPSRLSNDCKIL
jgi:hypothetical protein